MIEPQESLTFNRGLLFNIGFYESIKDMRVYTSEKKGDKKEPFWNCFVFHDVDMIPEDERLYYTCNENNPIHFAVAVRKFNYQ